MALTMKSQLRLTIVLTYLVTLTNHVCSDQIDDFVIHQMQQRHIPGLSLAVVKNGKIIKAKGYGLASVELNVPATKDTVYEIGSVTKVFTATAVMMLVNDAKIRLDDKITNYLSGLPPAWTDITVRHLLSHTSGITNDYADVGETSTRLRNPLSPKEFLESATNFPLASSPGEKWAYSNTGYYLLGLIIEKASGKSYADFMRQRTFSPLGMNSTGVYRQETVVTNRACGYSWWDYGGLHNGNYWDISWAYSAGGITSSVMDLARWDAALYTDELLPRAILEQMWAIEGRHFPFAWGVNISSRYGRELNHWGGTPGFSAGIARWIDQRLTIILLTNMHEVPSWDIVDGIVHFYLLDDPKRPHSKH
jgi:D-alanyl-D-alanine carboxypeptidase